MPAEEFKVTENWRGNALPADEVEALILRAREGAKALGHETPLVSVHVRQHSERDNMTTSITALARAGRTRGS
jgi:hypothetical protein